MSIELTAVYRAGEAAAAAKVSRQAVDAACQSGQLAASDARPESTKRQWRIVGEDVPVLTPTSVSEVDR